MDPLSIATGSASLVVLCVQVSATLYTWIDDTRQVDTNVAALCEEILALSRVLDAISKTWKRNPQIASAQTDDGTLWISVKASIDDCKATLEKLNLMLDDVQKGSFVGRGFLRKPAKQIKFSLKTKDISVYQQRMQSYNSAMQSALHMINLCLLLQSNSSQQTVSRTLSDLKSQIGRVENALTSREDLQISRDEREENERISRNLQQFVRAAESFHSSASTVAGDRSTVWGGSILGDPLTQDQLSSIESWIPPPDIAEADEPGEENASSTGLSASASNPFTNRDSTADTDLTSEQQNVQESDSDSDIEKDLTKKFQELALTKLEERDYEKAEQFFQKVIDRSATEEQPPENMALIKVNLAFAYCFQGRWEEAEGIIVPIAMGKQKVYISAFHGLHTLALLYFGKNDFETADKYCKRALTGKKKILGKDHASYFESINLLSRIYSAKGDQAESEVYRSFLPTGHTNELPNSPLDYLYKTMSGKRTAAPRVVPLLDTPPIGTPPPHPTPSPVSERSTFSPPPERPHKKWRERFGLSSSGSRTPNYSLTPASSRSTGYQQPAPQRGTHSPPYQLSAASRPSFPPPETTRPSYVGATRRASYSLSQPQLVVGIDFGTQSSSAAFAYATMTETVEDLITEWPGNFNKTRAGYDIITSVLYYDSHQKAVGWGPDIADALAPTGYPKAGVQKVEWFKLHLMSKGGNTYVDAIHLPPLPPGKTEIEVVADYLSKVREATMLQLRKKLGEIFHREEQNILYCFTFPTVFDESAKAALRAAIIQAGYVRDEYDERLILVEEPKALLIFCAKTGLLTLKPNDVFLIVDCGGATVDLISYEVVDENPLNIIAVTPASGDSCGSSAINRNFSNTARAKIRKMQLPEGSKTAARVYAMSVIDMENRIKEDFRNNGQKWAVDVGIEADFPEADIEEGYMVYTNEEILQCFEPVVNRIIALIRNEIISVQAQNKIPKSILVAGAFGSNEYLFQQIKLHVPPQFQSKVIRPMDSANATVKGAITACLIAKNPSSVSRRQFMVDVLQPFQTDRHPDYYCVTWPDGRLRCKYTYETVIAKGECVKFGEPKKISVEKFVAPGEPLMFEDRIYVYDDDDCPAFVIDPNIRLAETCTTDLSRKKPEVDFRQVRNNNGTFYLVNYDIYFILDGLNVSVETVFSGEVVARYSVPFLIQGSFLS